MWSSLIDSALINETGPIRTREKKKKFDQERLTERVKRVTIWEFYCGDGTCVHSPLRSGVGVGPVT